MDRQKRVLAGSDGLKELRQKIYDAVHGMPPEEDLTLGIIPGGQTGSAREIIRKAGQAADEACRGGTETNPADIAYIIHRGEIIYLRGGKLISAADWARQHNLDPASVRQKIARGKMPAVRVGKIYAVNENTPNIDHRIRSSGGGSKLSLDGPKKPHRAAQSVLQAGDRVRVKGRKSELWIESERLIPLPDTDEYIDVEGVVTKDAQPQDKKIEVRLRVGPELKDAVMQIRKSCIEKIS